jgi:putative flippase GtrA
MADSTMQDIPEVTIESVEEVLPLNRRASLMRFARRVSGAQFVRYILVGIWNTALNYGLYAGFTYLFTRYTVHGYLYAYILANVIGITVAFFGYKLLVFRTKGNYLKEYARCWIVYGSAMLIGLALLPVLKNAIAYLTPPGHSIFMLAGHVVDVHKLSPYIANALITVGTVVYSFFGHRKFSFRPVNPQQG